MKKRKPFQLIITLLLLGTINAFTAEPIVPDEKTRTDLTQYLESICQWIIDAELHSGELQIQDKKRTSIFINSNLGRVLIATYDLTGKEHYLQEALAWFDHFVAIQQKTEAPNGMPAGFWGDFSSDGNIYLGDTGTATTALAGAVRYARGERREKYMTALRLYANFVQYGSKDDPQGKGRGGSKGWIIKEGEDAGAIGCGYYRNELSTAPYTIATSVTGAAFFSALYVLTGERQYLTIAENAARWLMKVRKRTGEIPYILNNFELDQWPLDTISYVADGIVSVYRRTDDKDLQFSIVKSMSRSIQWLLNMQNKDGTWGELRSEDQKRSQGLLNLLVWYYNDVVPHPQVLESIRRNYTFFLNPENSEKFGVKFFPITTGFVGLAMAEVLEPGITYRLQ